MLFSQCLPTPSKNPCRRHVSRYAVRPLSYYYYYYYGGAEIAGVDNAGVDNDGGKAQEVDNDGVDFTELS